MLSQFHKSVPAELAELMDGTLPTIGSDMFYVVLALPKVFRTAAGGISITLPLAECSTDTLGDMTGYGCKQNLADSVASAKTYAGKNGVTMLAAAEVLSARRIKSILSGDWESGSRYADPVQSELAKMLAAKREATYALVKGVSEPRAKWATLSKARRAEVVAGIAGGAGGPAGAEMLTVARDIVAKAGSLSAAVIADDA